MIKRDSDWHVARHVQARNTVVDGQRNDQANADSFAKYKVQISVSQTLELPLQICRIELPLQHVPRPQRMITL